MTNARSIEASAARGSFVKRLALHRLPAVGVIGSAIVLGWAQASVAENPASADAGGKFQLRLALRPEPVPFLSLQGRTRGFQLRAFVESTLPPTETVKLSNAEEPENWDWAGYRRQLVRALSSAKKIRFERDAIYAEAERNNEPGRIPGVVQDAAIAAGVRAKLAGEPSLRGIPLEVQCRESCIRLRGQCGRCADTARAIALALAVEGVREVRADLPGELQLEMAADR